MENKHQSYDLAQMQSLPLNAKIIMTQQRIRAWYEYWDGDVYVSVSGGKDSQVLAHIVKEMYPDVPCVFINTGLEYDSVRLKGIELSDEVLRPEMNFVEVITKYGYPVISKEVSDCVIGARRYIESNGARGSIDRLNKLRGARLQNNGELSHYNYKKYEFLLDAPFLISPLCCDIMKKNPCKRYEKSTKRKPFLGTMATESRLRKQKWIKYGCNAFEQKGRKTSQPLSFWTEKDILLYISRYCINMADVYGRVVYMDEDGMQYDIPIFDEYMKENLITTGVQRSGCVFCMFGITQDPDRYLKLKELEPKKYDYVMRGGRFFYTVLDKNRQEIKLKHCKREAIINWCENNIDNSNFTVIKMWQPYKGLGYKFVIDWLNEHGNLNIRY